MPSGSGQSHPPAGRIPPGAGWRLPRWLPPAVRGWLHRNGRRLVIGLAVFLALVLLLRQPLAQWLWPQTHAEQLREEAAVALERGRLSVPDGSGARELYEAALAMDPDRGEARTGLARVALAALAQARQAVAQGRFDDAHANLQLARELSAPRADVEEVAAVLRSHEVPAEDRDHLWAQAERAHAEGHLYGTEVAALPLYRRLLTLDPDNADVLRAREDAIAELLQQARAELQHGQLAAAATRIAVAREFDPGHIDLPDTQARLAEERESLLRHARDDLAEGRPERARERFAELEAIEPGSADAAGGRLQVGLAFAGRAARLAQDFRLADADAALALARTLAPEHETVEAAAAAIERARRVKAQLDTRLTPAMRAQRVTGLLAEADAAVARGDALEPVGESAYDRLRAVRELAPDDPRLRAAGHRLLPMAGECFERELRRNSLGRARACLDAQAELGADPAALADGRRRLALRWLAVGDERLGAGELLAAQAALGAARDVDPATPGLAGFSHRLRQAAAGAGRGP